MRANQRKKRKQPVDEEKESAAAAPVPQSKKRKQPSAEPQTPEAHFDAEVEKLRSENRTMSMDEAKYEIASRLAVPGAQLRELEASRKQYHAVIEAIRTGKETAPAAASNEPPSATRPQADEGVSATAPPAVSRANSVEYSYHAGQWLPVDDARERIAEDFRANNS